MRADLFCRSSVGRKDSTQSLNLLTAIRLESLVVSHSIVVFRVACFLRVHGHSRSMAIVSSAIRRPSVLAKRLCLLF